MNVRSATLILWFVSTVLGLAPASAAAVPPPPFQVKYLYQLSDSNGAIESSWASLAYDAGHKELYVVDQSDGSVGIFNEVGMETYRFGMDAELGSVLSVSVMDNGDLLVLAMMRGKAVLQRCDFRGVPKTRIELSDLPPEFAKDFSPEIVIYRSGKIFLAQKGAMRVVVADASGKCLATHDFFIELALDKAKGARSVPAMHAFNVDARGNMLFTVAPVFRVYVVSPEGKATAFGQRGGAPGKFNITGGVARDEHGNIFVSDVLKCAVLAFNENFEFIGQFGARGWGDGDLIGPLEIAVAGGKLYVSQSARRGVSVFQLPTPSQAAAAGG